MDRRRLRETLPPKQQVFTNKKLGAYAPVPMTITNKMNKGHHLVGFNNSNRDNEILNNIEPPKVAISRKKVSNAAQAIL